MFDSIRQCQIVSPSGCTSLHSHHPLLQLLFQSYRKLRTRPKEWNRGWARFDISWERVRKRIVRWVLPTLQARLEFSSWPSRAHSHRQLIKVHQGPRSPSHSASPRSLDRGSLHLSLVLLLNVVSLQGFPEPLSYAQHWRCKRNMTGKGFDFTFHWKKNDKK